MSLPAAFEELQLGENVDLIQNYRKGVLSQSQEVELFELLYQLKEKYKGAFKLADVLKNNFDYVQLEVKRLDGEYHKWLKKQEKADSPALTPPGPGEPAIVQKAKEIGTGATKALFSEIQEIGNLLVLTYAQKAAIRGESLKEYILKCIDLRETYGDQIEALAQENAQLKALSGMLVEAVKPSFKQLAAARMYLDWTTTLLQLNVLGITVDERWVDDVTAKVEAALGVVISQ
jgi:hypothetical protein